MDAEDVRAWIDARAAKREFSGVASVWRDGAPVFAHASGLNLVRSQPTGAPVMTPTPRFDDTDEPNSPALTYRVTVAGHLDDHWSDWLGGHSLVRNPDVSTTLTIDSADQARLHGVLAGIRDLGVNLLSVSTVEASAAPSPAAEQKPPH